MKRKLTGISNLDANSSALERFSVKGKSLLQALHIAKFNVTKALRALRLAILNQTDGGDITALKELVDGIVGDIIGQIAQMGGIGGFVGDPLGSGLANGKS